MNDIKAIWIIGAIALWFGLLAVVVGTGRLLNVPGPVTVVAGSIIGGLAGAFIMKTYREDFPKNKGGKK